MDKGNSEYFKKMLSVQSYDVKENHALTNKAFIDSTKVELTNLDTDVDKNELEPLASMDTSNMIEPLASISTSNMIGSLASIDTSNMIGSLASIDTSNMIGSLASIDTSNMIGVLASTSTSNMIEPLASISTSNMIGPLASMDTSNIIGSLASISTSNMIEPLASISTNNMIRSLASISTNNMIGPLASIDMSNMIGSLASISTSNMIGPLASIDTSMYSNTLKSLLGVSSNWILSDSVVNSMSLINRKEESKYIFDKISKDDYFLSYNYDGCSDALEIVLESKEQNESIPVRDLPSTLVVSDIVTSLDAKDVIEFYRHIVKYPMLGLEHPVGRRIFNEISTNLVEVEKARLFRARGRDIHKRRLPFSDIEMFQAPHGLSEQGRYNVVGQGELYTCTDREIALSEVASQNPNLRYELIEWELQHSVKLLDLSENDSPLVQYCNFDKRTINRQEYLLPNFLAQCAKYHGIHGIIYKSVKNPEVLNYVFFDFEQRWFKSIDLLVDLESLT